MLRRLAAPLLLTAGLCSSAAAADCVQTVRRNPDPNASGVRIDGQPTGVRLSLTLEALRRMGCRAVVKDLPWSRALTDLAAGELDVLPAAHRTPEREGFALFSTRLTPALFRVFVRRGLEQQQPADLDALHRSGLKLGLQSGVTYGAALEALLADPAFATRVERVVSRAGLWRMLARGRVDAVLAEDAPAVWELEQLGLIGEVQASALVVEGEATSTAFSRRGHDVNFVARFDAALAEMARDGTEQAIIVRLREVQKAQSSLPKR
jgi:polar amino acid transport system substrate-binding protein